MKPKPPPIAYFQHHPPNVEASPNITFNASLSYDPDGGKIISYQWNFGDGSAASGRIVEHAYSEVRDYPVQLTVTDDEGNVSSRSIVVPAKLEEQQVPSPEPSPTPSPLPLPSLSLPTESIYAIAGIVIIIVVVAAVGVLKKRAK